MTTNAPGVVGKSSVPLEIIIPLLLAPLILTPLGVFLGFMCYRRCRIIRKKRKRYWDICIELAEGYSSSSNKIGNNFLQERRGSRDDKESATATSQQWYYIIGHIYIYINIQPFHVEYQ